MEGEMNDLWRVRIGDHSVRGFKWEKFDKDRSFLLVTMASKRVETESTDPVQVRKQILLYLLRHYLLDQVERLGLGRFRRKQKQLDIEDRLPNNHLDLRRRMEKA